MKKFIFLVFVFTSACFVRGNKAGAMEVSFSPNYGVVLSPDLDNSGGLGYTGRLLLAGDVFRNYEMGFESGMLSLYQYNDTRVNTIPITAILRYNFYAVGDIKPYFLTGAGVYHSRTDNDNSSTSNDFGASAGIGTRMVSTGMPFFMDMLLRGTFIFDSDYENDMLVMLHVGFGLGLKF